MSFSLRCLVVIAGRGASLALLVAAGALPLSLAAQVAQPAKASCPPRAAAKGPAFVFGNEGGNLKRTATRLWANGAVQATGGRRTAPNAALADSVRTLARFARQSGFWTTTAPRITRPTRNPDMAREYVDAHLQCGTRRSLYPADATPAPFRELYRRLAAITALAGGR